MLELTRPDDVRFLWITEFPMLEWDEEENRFVAVHHPFTAPMDEDLELLDTNPGAVRAKAYDIVLNGYELGGGSIRIHRRDIQQKLFELLGFTPVSYTHLNTKRHWHRWKNVWHSFRNNEIQKKG